MSRIARAEPFGTQTTTLAFIEIEGNEKQLARRTSPLRGSSFFQFRLLFAWTWQVLPWIGRTMPLFSTGTWYYFSLITMKVTIPRSNSEWIASRKNRQTKLMVIRRELYWTLYSHSFNSCSSMRQPMLIMASGYVLQARNIFSFGLVFHIISSNTVLSSYSTS